MALTQMQIIQSLGEAMAWFERELNWGVPPTELRHLCGRIGELYAALITNGQMATEVNQQGYDVVSASGERISVKTTATMGYGGHVSFNPNSLAFVDRVLVLRINTEEMQIETLLDAPVADAVQAMSAEHGGKRNLSLGPLGRKERPRSELKTVREVDFREYTVRELENGSIEVEQDGSLFVPAKPVLRELARDLNIGLLNSNGNPLNTRQLGSQIIASLSEA
ncbi:DUF6998 domain-containing protein [Marinobacter sp.]|uniref:DUF6998 domain-containing protein n=1 Tax=Marinobacter sp. TaxID=50741 RepID=UPI00384C70EB